MKKLIFLFFVFSSWILFSAFNIDNAIVPKDKILSGGPPKDGIPAILQPKFVSTNKADFMKPEDQVIGVRIGDQARAYPIKILNWYEAVNDRVKGIPFLVSF